MSYMTISPFISMTCKKQGIVCFVYKKSLACVISLIKIFQWEIIHDSVPPPSKGDNSFSCDDNISYPLFMDIPINTWRKCNS